MKVQKFHVCVMCGKVDALENNRGGKHNQMASLHVVNVDAEVLNFKKSRNS